jgi:hypothetical protein
MSARVILFHSLAHARAVFAAAAAERGAPVTLQSAPGAAAYAGAGYLKAIVERAAAEHADVAVTAVIDCGADAGIAMAALRIGWPTVRFSGPEKVRAKLADIAAECGARLVADEPEAAALEALDLLDSGDPLAACRAFLSR